MTAWIVTVGLLMLAASYLVSALGKALPYMTLRERWLCAAYLFGAAWSFYLAWQVGAR